MFKTRSGFTLVELLIVIVVIAILAAITLVAYNGIQTQAQRSAVKSRVEQWNKVVKLYIAAHNARPQGQWACIGKTSDFPAAGDFPAGVCAVTSTDGGSTWSTDYTGSYDGSYRVDQEGTQLSNQLSEFTANAAVTFSPITLKNGSWITKWRGIVYDDYSNGYISIVYAVPGDSCVTSAWTWMNYGNGRLCYYDIARADTAPTLDG